MTELDSRSGSSPTRVPNEGLDEVRVLYFAVLRDLVGRAEERVLLPMKNPLLGDVIRLLEARHPALSLDSVRVALNEEFADASAPVTHGDVVALIPPVSGG